MLREIRNLTDFWNSERWNEIKRPYTKEDVIKFCHSFMIDYTLANNKAESFWNILTQEDQIYGMSASNAEEGIDQAEAGMDFLCLDNTTNILTKKTKNIPHVINNVNKLFHKGYGSTPIVIKTKPLGFKEMTKIIQSGVAGIWCDDENVQKNGQRTGDLLSTKSMITQLTQVRLAADVCRVPSIIIASTKINNSEMSENCRTNLSDQKYESTKTNNKEIHHNLDTNVTTEKAIERGLAYAPYADVICLEGIVPDLEQAEKFANAIRSKYPRKYLAYSCTSIFDWTTKLTPTEMQNFQNELTELGYSIHYISPREETFYTMRKLAESFCDDGFAGYANLEEIFSKVDHQINTIDILKTIQDEQTTLV